MHKYFVQKPHCTHNLIGSEFICLNKIPEIFDSATKLLISVDENFIFGSRYYYIIIYDYLLYIFPSLGERNASLFLFP